MAVLSLVIAPDERLNTPSKPVEVVNDEIRKLCDDMLETMYASKGIGLAAVQVGVMKRVIVVDVEWGSSRYDDEGSTQDTIKNAKPLKLINPEIIESSDELSSYNEGCLSFPDQYSDVKRPAEVTIRYLNEKGEEKKARVTGLLSTCIQHEIDHINGIVFVDHVSKLKRDMIIRKLKKAKKIGTIEVHPEESTAM